MSTLTPEAASSVRDAGLASLAVSRGLLKQQLEGIEGDAWTRPPYEGGNHALWTVGHLATSDTGFARGLGVELDVPHGYPELFGMGSEPKAAASAYPDPQGVVELFHTNREALREAARAANPATLAEPRTGPMSDIIPNGAMLVVFCAQHEMVHAGQMGMIRRALGLPRVI
ncbi:MAG: DinB family protein [Planctomycetota bacterium]